MHPDRRLHPRFHLEGLTARIEGMEAPILDISVYGLRMANPERIRPQPALRVTVHIRVPVDGKTIVHEVEAEVVWANGKEVALAYAAPSRTWPELIASLPRVEE